MDADRFSRLFVCLLVVVVVVVAAVVVAAAAQNDGWETDKLCPWRERILLLLLACYMQTLLDYYQ